MQVQITSKTGKQITLAINATYTGIDAKCGNIEFGAEQTASGFKSRLLVPEVGNRRIEVACEGAELEKVQAIFAELHSAIAARAKADADYEAHRDAVIRTMHGGRA